MVDNFIEDTQSRLDEIRKLWGQFQNGELTKEAFEEEYTLTLEMMQEDVEDERFSPNNECKYSDVYTDNKYFKEKDY